MKHCISIQPGTSYARALDIIAEEDPSAQAREFTPGGRHSEDPYMLLTVITEHEISGETEMAIDCLPNVIVSVFNIEE